MYARNNNNHNNRNIKASNNNHNNNHGPSSRPPLMIVQSNTATFQNAVNCSLLNETGCDDIDDTQCTTNTHYNNNDNNKNNNNPFSRNKVRDLHNGKMDGDLESETKVDYSEKRRQALSSVSFSVSTPPSVTPGFPFSSTDDNDHDIDIDDDEIEGNDMLTFLKKLSSIKDETTFKKHGLYSLFSFYSNPTINLLSSRIVHYNVFL